tara:strand:+ start:462 stop:641 length:180 start_codon:yes stop_codon:yes gene_type:complete
MQLKRDVRIIESVWDTIMKNIKYKNIDFTKFKDAYIDYNKKQIDLGDYVLTIKHKTKLD